MSGYQKAQYRMPYISSKIPTKSLNKGVNAVEHMKSLSQPLSQAAIAINMNKLQAGINKQSQMDLLEIQPDYTHFRYKQTHFRLTRKKYIGNPRRFRIKV